jgi:hypothetical protein
MHETSALIAKGDAILVDARDLKALENLRGHSQRIYSPPPLPLRVQGFAVLCVTPLGDAKMTRPEYGDCSAASVQQQGTPKLAMVCPPGGAAAPDRGVRDQAGRGREKLSSRPLLSCHFVEAFDSQWAGRVSTSASLMHGSDHSPHNTAITIIAANEPVGSAPQEDGFPRRQKLH